ncbi:MAG: PLP-dependent aminotransferase family protein [Calditrichaeota bacterium]|nr:PLP-dependent aminotransferase family protein [Calditrichota bacterium]RQW07746.1 MAG: PLP-dependent aminotransferase family protein [Calditrichota bacterium]
MVLLNIDRKSTVPVYQQILNQMIELIENESLKTGDQLPPTRKLADRLGLDRTTVTRAYLELNALGYVESRPGSYTRVRKRIPVIRHEYETEEPLINWSSCSNAMSNKLFEYFLNFRPESVKDLKQGVINLSPLDLDYRLFPVNEFRRCLNQVMVNIGSELLRYGDYQGYAPLREDIAGRLRIHGIRSSADEILITNGAQQALELILKLLGKPREKVAIEAPTYANVIPLIRHHNLDLMEIPMKEQGMDLDYLADEFRKKVPLFVYTIPNFQNPTGITSSQEHRENLLAICEKYRLPLVEDGFEEEMKYYGKVVLPVKSMDRHQIVLYLGTFSKVLFPGIRIGWIAAEKECIQRLTAIKRFTDLTGSNLVQAALSAFLRNGYYDLHLKKMHRVFRKRMTIALQALEGSMPSGATWTRPDGGYTIWVSLPRSYQDEQKFKQLLIKKGVLASPGLYYFYSSHQHKYFRLSISSLEDGEIREGIYRLAEAIRELMKKEN